MSENPTKYGIVDEVDSSDDSDDDDILYSDREDILAFLEALDIAGNL